MTSGDTIAAISSAVGSAARMIVRTSGPQSWNIARELSSHKQLRAGAVARATLTFDSLSFPATLYCFASPRSYTREDLIEYHISGNPLLARMLLDELVQFGARRADPGEFTARAYFNGRIDLTEAEGVAATIAAHGEDELRAARQLAAGELSRRLKPVMNAIAETLGLVEVGIDFSEEDISFLSPEEIRERSSRANKLLGDLVGCSARFERLSHEPQVVLAGRPNAGKSTLLNALAGQERAVVSHVSGTTRDVISAEVALNRGIVRVIDVAGLDEIDPPAAFASAADQIARQMREHALRTLESADLVILVRDATDDRPPFILSRAANLVVRTKIDLHDAEPRISDEEIRVSARSGKNLDLLRERLDAIAFGQETGGAALALNARHLHSISDARAALARAADRADEGAELVALELREALDALGAVLGSISPDDLLGQIFSKFCIGK